MHRDGNRNAGRGLERHRIRGFPVFPTGLHGEPSQHLQRGVPVVRVIDDVDIVDFRQGILRRRVIEQTGDSHAELPRPGPSWYWMIKSGFACEVSSIIANEAAGSAQDELSMTKRSITLTRRSVRISEAALPPENQPGRFRWAKTVLRNRPVTRPVRSSDLPAAGGFVRLPDGSAR